MKSKLLLGAMLVFGLSKAQETSFGVKGGYSLSMSRITMTQGKGTAGNKSSFYIGGMVEHKFSKNWGVQAELLYSKLGWNQDQLQGNRTVKVDTDLNSLLVPISVKYFFDENFSLQGGVNLAFTMSQKMKMDNKDYKINSFNTFNLSPFIGAEYAFDNGLFIDARYSRGLTNIEKVNKNMKIYNDLVQVGIGYKFK